MLRLCLYKCIELLNPFKHHPLRLQHVYPHLPKNIINEDHKLFCIVHTCGLGWPYTSIYMVSKGLVARHHLDTMSYHVYHYYMLPKSRKMWDEEFYQSSYHSSFFEVHEHTLYSNAQADDTKAQMHNFHFTIVSKRRINSMHLNEVYLVHITFTWSFCSQLSIRSSYNIVI